MLFLDAFLGTECSQGPRVPDVMKKAIVRGVFAEAMVPNLICKEAPGSRCTVQ